MAKGLIHTSKLVCSIPIQFPIRTPPEDMTLLLSPASMKNAHFFPNPSISNSNGIGFRTRAIGLQVMTIFGG